MNAIPLLKSAPEPDQLADRLDGGDWRGIEIALMPKDVADDDALAAIEALVAMGRWNETVLIASGRSTSLLRAAELVRDAAGSSSPIETPGGELPAGENESYQAAPEAPLPLNLSLEEGIRRYVNWLQNHPAAEVRARA